MSVHILFTLKRSIFIYFFACELSVFSICSAARSQTHANLNGFGLELGASNNNLIWSGKNNIKTPGGVPVNRTRLAFHPEVRLRYSLLLFDNFFLQPFSGYGKMGGNGKYDSYAFNAAEVGLFALYRFKSFSIGAGGKINYHQHVYYTTASNKEERSNWFSQDSNDLGVRMTLHRSPLDFSLEAWRGLDNLAAGPTESAKHLIHCHQYRMMFGYTF